MKRTLFAATFVLMLAVICMTSSAFADSNFVPANRSGNQPYAEEYKSRKPALKAQADGRSEFFRNEGKRSGMDDFWANSGRFFESVWNLEGFKEQEERYLARKGGSNLK